MPKRCRLNIAKLLISEAEYILYPRNALIIINKGISVIEDHNLAFAQLALRFHRASPALKLRAMVENWSQQRIVRELY